MSKLITTFLFVLCSSIAMAEGLKVKSQNIQNLPDFNDLGGKLQVQHLNEKHPGIAPAIGAQMQASYHQDKDAKEFIDNLYVGVQPSTNTMVIYECKTTSCDQKSLVATTSARVIKTKKLSANLVKEFFTNFRVYRDLQGLGLQSSGKYLRGGGLEVESNSGAFFAEGSQTGRDSNYSKERLAQNFTLGFKRTFKKGVSARVEYTRVEDNFLNYSDNAIVAVISVKR